MDTLSTSQRSAVMARVRSKDTSPEIEVRRAVFGAGFRYRLHARHLPGKPDLVFPAQRKVVFVNGCFWHGHRCPLGRMPKSRVSFWQSKIDGNRARDSRTRSRLTRLGWKVHVVWECQLQKSGAALDRVVRFLSNDHDV